MSTLLCVAFFGIFDVLNFLVAVRWCHRVVQPGLSYQSLQFCTGLFNANSIYHTFSHEKDLKLEENKLDSSGLRDSLLSSAGRIHTYTASINNAFNARQTWQQSTVNWGVSVCPKGSYDPAGSLLWQPNWAATHSVFTTVSCRCIFPDKTHITKKTSQEVMQECIPF